MKLIFILSRCDDWKTPESMNTFCVTTSWDKIVKKIKKEVGDIGYYIKDYKEVLKEPTPENVYQINNIGNIFLDVWED